MKTFEEYLDKMGYSWNDFDRTNEMENLIEQYADEKAKQALSIADVSHRRERLKAFLDWQQNKYPMPYDTDIEEQLNAFEAQTTILD